MCSLYSLFLQPHQYERRGAAMMVKMLSVLQKRALPSACKVSVRRAGIALSTTASSAGDSTYSDEHHQKQSQHALSTTASSAQGEDDEHHPQQSQHTSQMIYPTKNIRLEAIKSVGITQLHNQTQDLISRTRQPLFDQDSIDPHGKKQQTIAQIQEGTRLESALIDALGHYSSRHNTFSVGGQCIEVLGVEVSPDLKQARAYWCLPRSIDLRAIPDKKLKQIVKRMQQILEERGGKIQGLVHTRLRAYYPPKIVWVAAEHISKDLKRGVSLDGGKKKKWS